MVFVYLVHVTHVLRGSQSSKFMIMFYHARAADTESKYSRNPAARAKKSPENAVSAFRHESVHRVICSLAHSLTRSLSYSLALLLAPETRTHGKEAFVYELNASISCHFSPQCVDFMLFQPVVRQFYVISAHSAVGLNGWVIGEWTTQSPFPRYIW